MDQAMGKFVKDACPKILWIFKYTLIRLSLKFVIAISINFYGYREETLKCYRVVKLTNRYFRLAFEWHGRCSWILSWSDNAQLYQRNLQLGSTKNWIRVWILIHFVWSGSKCCRGQPWTQYKDTAVSQKLFSVENSLQDFKTENWKKNEILLLFNNCTRIDPVITFMKWQRKSRMKIETMSKTDTKSS